MVVLFRVTILSETVNPVSVLPTVSSCGKDGMGNVQLLSSFLLGMSKLKIFPGILRFMKPSPGTDVTLISPPGAVSVPVFTTVPADKLKLCPVPTSKLPALMIAPG